MRKVDTFMPREKAAEHGTRISRQCGQKLDRMLKELPRQCDIGVKTSSKGHQQYWRGYKLHLDVADGQLPISAVLTSASVHDSQVAIPLMTMTSQRVVHLYELMDSAYDADSITRPAGSSTMCRSLLRIRGAVRTRKPSIMQKVFPDKPTPEFNTTQQLARSKTRNDE